MAGIENPQYAREMAGLRRSNAAGTHDDRPNRERSRSDSKRAAIKRELRQDKD